MQHPLRRPFGTIVLSWAALAATLAPAAPSLAEGLRPPADAAPPAGPASAGHWRFYASPYTYHWQYNPEHRPVWSLGVEWQRPQGWLLGGAYFRNSFDQPSTYLYGGRRWSGLLDRPPFYVQFTAGLLYGYRGRYANKVPLNRNGYSPGAVLALGWEFDRHHSVSLDVLGASAVMFQYNYDLR
ncbi:MAG: ABC transporter ATP-binding protein [Burkholderiales bacterium]|nr:ABC transporter ATP-binding protein [Burkholderiales bacterium]